MEGVKAEWKGNEGGLCLVCQWRKIKSAQKRNQAREKQKRRSSKKRSPKAKEKARGKHQVQRPSFFSFTSSFSHSALSVCFLLHLPPFLACPLSAFYLLKETSLTHAFLQPSTKVSEKQTTRPTAPQSTLAPCTPQPDSTQGQTLHENKDEYRERASPGERSRSCDGDTSDSERRGA